MLILMAPVPGLASTQCGSEPFTFVTSSHQWQTYNPVDLRHIVLIVSVHVVDTVILGMLTREVVC